MSVRRPSGQEEQQQMVEAERARLRRIGITFIAGAIVVLAIATIVLSGGSKDDPRVVIVFAEGARVDVDDIDDGDLLRVTGTFRRAIQDRSYSDENANALFADTISLSRPTDSASDITPVSALRDDNAVVDQEITVVGEVENVFAADEVIAIIDPEDGEDE